MRRLRIIQKKKKLAELMKETKGEKRKLVPNLKTTSVTERGMDVV